MLVPTPLPPRELTEPQPLLVLLEGAPLRRRQLELPQPAELAPLPATSSPVLAGPALRKVLLVQVLELPVKIRQLPLPPNHPPLLAIRR